MKEKFLNELIQELSNHGFVNSQLTEIKKIITSKLETYTLEQKTENRTNENEYLMEQYLLTKKIEGCSPKTLRYYRLMLSVYKKELSIDFRDVSADEIRLFLNTYQSKRNASNITLDNIRRVLSSFYNWLEEDDYVIKNPMKKIHKIKFTTLVKDTFNDEQIEELRQVTNNRLREYAMQELLLSSGIRVGELVNLNRDSIDFNTMSCIVKGKGDKERIVYFNARTKVALQQYLNSRKDNHKALFKSLRRNKRLTINAVESIFRRIGHLANIKNVHPHKYRRTMATRALEKGMPIEQVQKLLGHTKIDTTLHYTMINQTMIMLSHRMYIG